MSEDVRRGEELAAADKDGQSTVSGDTKIGGQVRFVEQYNLCHSS